MRVSGEAKAPMAGTVTRGCPPPWFERWKPAAPARTHVLAAAAVWTGVGMGLGMAGLVWTAEADAPWPWLLVPLAVAVGLAKGRLALDRAARRAAGRIRARGDGRCLGGFLSWRMWLFVLGMMLLGGALRRSSVPRPVLGFVYTAVGASLLWGSRIYWRVWRGWPGGS